MIQRIAAAERNPFDNKCEESLEVCCGRPPPFRVTKIETLTPPPQVNRGKKRKTLRCAFCSPAHRLHAVMSVSAECITKVVQFP